MSSLYRIHPQPSFNFGGLVIDNFAGGGASTGMDPRDISGVLRHLAEAQAIELTDELELIHPMHGFMGHTRGARALQTSEVAA